jgi:hypothetical protein
MLNFLTDPKIPTGCSKSFLRLFLEYYVVEGRTLGQHVAGDPKHLHMNRIDDTH